MTRTISISPVRKSVVVQATPGLAFDIFTNGIDSWWPKSHSMGGAPFKLSVIEPFAGGRWYAERQDGSEVSIAHVVTWEPGHRVVFRWEIGPGWKPDPDHSSELEIKFIHVGPEQTRVELEHRNFDRAGGRALEDHRNGLDRGWPVAIEQYAAEVSLRLASRSST